MARPARLELPRQIYYVTGKAKDGLHLFQAPADGKDFLHQVAKAATRFKWQLYGFQLTPETYHLVIRPLEATLSRGMRDVTAGYSQNINLKRNTRGALFQGRFKSIAVERGPHLADLLSGLTNLPVDLKLAASVEQWKWGSYMLSTIRPGIAEGLELSDLVPFKYDPEVSLEAVLAQVRYQSLLGSDEFVSQVRQAQTNMVASGNLAADRDKTSELPVPNTFDTLPARNAAMADAYIEGHYSLTEIAAHFGVHISTVSRAVAATENP